MMETTREITWPVALLSGGAAGLAVDLILFPLDTMKTRLQSSQGFRAAGGFHRIYQGLGSVALGSAPGAAVFFLSYELGNRLFGKVVSEDKIYLSHMASAAFGETCACLIRVPVEVVKQRAQANLSAGSFAIFQRTLATEGFVGLYRGYTSTVLREIPFSLIQFPLWEMLKRMWSKRQNGRVDSWQSAVCGSVAGGISAALTTPLDVAKTRIMLAQKGSETATRSSICFTLQQVRRERGLTGIYAGILPRTVWMSVGGCIFLGVYDKMRLELGCLTH